VLGISHRVTTYLLIVELTGPTNPQAENYRRWSSVSSHLYLGPVLYTVSTILNPFRKTKEGSSQRVITAISQMNRGGESGDENGHL
jgi:hypothetical protein